MRSFFKMSPQFWTGDTGRAIRQAGIKSQLMAAYLCLSPHASAHGIYYLPLNHVTEAALSAKDVQTSMRELCDLGFCVYDVLGQSVWVIEMAKYQVGELKAKDRMVNWVNREYRQLPKSPFLAPFYDKYCDALRLESRRVSDSPWEALGSGVACPSQGQLSLSIPMAAEEKPGGKRATGQKTAMPEDFTISDAVRAWAAENGIAADLEKELEAFKDWHGSKASRFADWDAALRSWLRKVRTFAARGPKEGGAALREMTRKILQEGIK